MSENAHVEYMQTAFAFGVRFSLASVPLAFFGGTLAYLLTGTLGAALTISAGTFLLCSIIVAFVLLASVFYAQRIIAETVSAALDYRDAEREALQGGRALIQHTQVDARGIGNQIAVQQAPQETIRLVPFHSARKLIDGLPPAAIAFFIDQYPVRGWSQREWVDRGIRLPGMKEPVDYDTWRNLLSILEKVEAIPPVRERVKVSPILDLDVIKHKALGRGTDSTD